MYPHPTNTFGRPSHDSEMFDGCRRRTAPPRLSDRDKALIRFLIANDCTPREIQGHAKAGWSLDSIRKYKNERTDKDGEHITQEFHDILTEIKAGSSTGVNAPLKNANPPGVSNTGDNVPRTRASTNKTTSGRLLVDAANANASGSGSGGSNAHQATVPATNIDFLWEFVNNAGIDHKWCAMLRAAGFTKAQKLYSIAELGKHEVEHFVGAAPELAGMSRVDKTLLVNAFMRIANQG